MTGTSESFHPDFKKQMSDLLGQQYADFSRSMQQPVPVSIRINPQKGSSVSGTSVPWCSSGFYLTERPVFTLDPAFHAGAYYVQEASSMFLEQIIHVISKEKRLRVLDLCAAPGGKSTHLLSLLPPESLLVANEVIRSRASILIENLQKWGYPNAVVTSNDPRDFRKLFGFFDVILVDAPCSGEGLFRKDEEARKEWSLDAVHVCVGRQRRILEDIWPALKAGGLLIYCTCTFNERETEENLGRPGY
jgi:16S rRNA C967 or C1407 C5-methylase (RsmB/RsmF family)